MPANFIPSIWAAGILKERDKLLIGVKHCNRDYEGSIKEQGDRVKIITVGTVNSYDYTKGTDINAAETPADADQWLIIDQAKYANIGIEDLDKVQANQNLMVEYKRQMGIKLANDLDNFVFGKYADAGKTITNASVSTANIFSTIAEVAEYFKTIDVPEGIEKYLEVSPAIATKIILAKILRDTDNSKIIETGYLGKILGFNVYESNNIVKNSSAYECLARTKVSFAFAEQLTKTEAYRPEKRFSDAVKALQVWGGKVIRPKEFVRVTLTPAAESTI